MNVIEKRIKNVKRIKVKPFFPPPSLSLETKWKITIHSARKENSRWEHHRKSSDQSFYKKGLGAVGEGREVDICRYSTFFVEARLNEPEGKLIGGIRMQLPDANGKLPIIDELKGYIDTREMENFLGQFEAKKIVYGSGLWITPKYNFPGLSADLARAYFLLVYISKAYWHTACVPHHILEAWGSLGWRNLSIIPAFYYPDKRFKSFVLFGSRDYWPGALLKWIKEQDIDLKNLKDKNIVTPMRVQNI